MKRIVALLFVIAVLLGSMSAGTVNAIDETVPRRVNRLLSFGDSIVQGEAFSFSHSDLSSNRFGDEHFVNLLAREYGLSSQIDDPANDRWVKRCAVNGAVISDHSFAEEHWTGHLTRINSIKDDQIKGVPLEYIRNADTIVMNGGINDLSKAVFFDDSGYINYGKPRGFDVKLRDLSMSEMQTYVTQMKNMTEAELADFKLQHADEGSVIDIFQTWQSTRDRVRQSYTDIMNYLDSVGFGGKVYILNNINPIAETNYSALEYMWDEAIDFCLIAPMKDVERAFDNAVLVDINKQLRSYKYTGGTVNGGGDILHMSIAGSRATYQCISKAVDSEADTIQFPDDVVPSGCQWRKLYDWADGDISMVEAGAASLVSNEDAQSIISFSDRTSNYFMKSTKVNGSNSVTIDISGMDFSNVYGLRVSRCSTGGAAFKVTASLVPAENSGARRLFAQWQGNYSNELMQLFNCTMQVNTNCGEHDNQFLSTTCSVNDVRNAAAIEVSAKAKSASVPPSQQYDEELYIESVQVYTPLSQEQVNMLADDRNAHSVTVDGKTVKNYTGAEYVLPALGKDCVAYTDGTNYYMPGESFTLNRDYVFNSVSLAFNMLKGASMRFNVAPGIRFYSAVDTDLIERLEAAGAVINMGTLIAPSGEIAGQNFTKEMTGVFYDVKYISRDWYTDSGGFKGMVGSIISIREANINRYFVGRGYITVSFMGTTTTIYGGYDGDNIESNMRSICQLANRVKTYGYQHLSEENLRIVNGYIEKYTGDEEGYDIIDPVDDDKF